MIGRIQYSLEVDLTEVPIDASLTGAYRTVLRGYRLALRGVAALEPIDRPTFFCQSEVSGGGVVLKVVTEASRTEDFMALAAERPEADHRPDIEPFEGRRQRRIAEAPFAAAIFDGQLAHAAASTPWLRMFGIDQHAYLGHRLDELTPDPHRELTIALERALGGRITRKEEERLVDGRGNTQWIRWEARPWCDSQRSIIGALVYVVDISAITIGGREPGLPVDPERSAASAIEATPPGDPARGLAFAVIASSVAPLLLLDGRFNVIAASASFCRTFQFEQAAVLGRSVFALGTGEWDAPQLRSLFEAIGAPDAKVEACEIDLRRQSQDDRRLILSAQKLTHGDADTVRILLAVTDVTAARSSERSMDELLREKAFLLEALRHRVANSLQLIASLLLQQARTVQSEETRSQLHDAHHRVMTVATLKHQLTAAGAGDIVVGAYFNDLRQSIHASMIHERSQLSLTVNTDESVTSADTSISLGLIVTELVINALKHAFPQPRPGRIAIDYRSSGEKWILSVTDDGVGMPADRAGLRVGLGTSIVEALARRLKAQVRIVDMHPGTEVSVAHI
jgi:PAS domain S-box-containing protein